jgi:hypothetical protein
MGPKPLQTNRARASLRPSRRLRRTLTPINCVLMRSISESLDSALARQTCINEILISIVARDGQYGCWRRPPMNVAQPPRFCAPGPSGIIPSPSLRFVSELPDSCFINSIGIPDGRLVPIQFASNPIKPELFQLFVESMPFDRGLLYYLSIRRFYSCVRISLFVNEGLWNPDRHVIHCRNGQPIAMNLPT